MHVQNITEEYPIVWCMIRSIQEFLTTLLASTITTLRVCYHIRVSPFEHHSVPHHRQLHFFVQQLTLTHKKLCITGPLWRESVTPIAEVYGYGNRLLPLQKFTGKPYANRHQHNTNDWNLYIQFAQMKNSRLDENIVRLALNDAFMVTGETNHQWFSRTTPSRVKMISASG